MSLSNDIDLFELLNNPNLQIYKDLTEEFFNIEQQLKRQMDAGVEPSMMEAYRGLYLSAQTAGDVVKSMQDKEQAMSSLGVYDALSQGFNSISSQADKIKTEMTKISSLSSEDKQTALINMQFEIGTYNSMVELTSNITKTICDTVKSISQKVG